MVVPRVKRGRTAVAAGVRAGTSPGPLRGGPVKRRIYRARCASSASSDDDLTRKENTMRRFFLGSLSAALGLGLLVSTPQTAAAQRKAPPGGAYKKVSTLVPLPDFLPGLGTLYVDPSTLPAGPFLAYDREGKLVSSIYMIPLKDLNAHKKLYDLNVAKEGVDHVDMYYNAGHPAVPEPHYHIVLWYIPADKESLLK